MKTAKAHNAQLTGQIDLENKLITDYICRECGKKTIDVFSFDIDLPKFGFCRKHKEAVRNKLFMLVHLGINPKFKYPKCSKIVNKKKK